MHRTPLSRTEPQRGAGARFAEAPREDCRGEPRIPLALKARLCPDRTDAAMPCWKLLSAGNTSAGQGRRRRTKRRRSSSGLLPQALQAASAGSANAAANARVTGGDCCKHRRLLQVSSLGLLPQTISQLCCQFHSRQADGSQQTVLSSFHRCRAHTLHAEGCRLCKT